MSLDIETESAAHVPFSSPAGSVKSARDMALRPTEQQSMFEGGSSLMATPAADRMSEKRDF